MKHLFKQPFFYTSILALIALGLIIGSYVFGWVTPTATPPGGNITLSQGVNYWTLSGTYLFPTSTSYNVGIGTATPGALLDVQGGAQFGSGNVNLIDSTGKIPAISSTYFTSLSGANLTSLNASNLGSGTVPTARLPFDQGDITSDWASSSWTSGYYDVTNLTPANILSGITFGRSQTGTLVLPYCVVCSQYCGGSWTWVNNYFVTMSAARYIQGPYCAGIAQTVQGGGYYVCCR